MTTDPQVSIDEQPVATIAAPPAADPLKTLELKPRVIEALCLVYDPEIPVNIYELGLVYDAIVAADASVWVRMTLTSPACPSAQQLPGEVEARVRAVQGVGAVHVEIVWDPPWGPERMSDEARLHLGLL